MRVDISELKLNYVEHGTGENVVLAVHGNLGCADWLALVLPLLPQSLRVIAAEWRGCGDSDKPDPAADYSNYTMRTHAGDMLALLDALGKPHSLIKFVEDRPGHDRRYAIDPSRAETDLGWRPMVTWEKGLEFTINWYRENKAWVGHIRSGEYRSYYDSMYAGRLERSKPAAE